MHVWRGKWRKDRETSTGCPSALSPPSITIRLSLRWPDVGFVCPVSVSCVFFARVQWKETVSRLFLCVYGVYMRLKYIYTDIFFFCFFKAACDRPFDKQFCKPTDMPMYFSVFLGQKNMLHIVSSILACVRMVIWNNTLYRCFDFLGISIAQTIPPFGDGCLALPTYLQLCLSQKCQKMLASFSLMRRGIHH